MAQHRSRPSCKRGGMVVLPRMRPFNGTTCRGQSAHHSALLATRKASARIITICKNMYSEKPDGSESSVRFEQRWAVPVSVSSFIYIICASKYISRRERRISRSVISSRAPGRANHGGRRQRALSAAGAHGHQEEGMDLVLVFRRRKCKRRQSEDKQDG